MKNLIKWVPLMVLSLALTIIILDTTILNVTLRTIIQDLHTNIQSIQWVITAYALMLAAFTITGGRLGDLFGRKKMFVVGAIIFAIGSFMTSIAHSVGFMIWGEAIIEGVGAALMIPATASLLRSTYKGRDLSVAFGIWGGIVAGAAALGPVIGGWFTTHYTWRWAFRINVFVAAILVLASVLIKEYRDTEEKSDLDFLGIALSALGMLSLVFGFIQSSVYGWWKQLAPLKVMGQIINLGGISATPLFIVLGIVILAIFLYWEKIHEESGNTPLISLGLFENKTFVTGSLVSGLLALGQSGLSFGVPIYLQSVLNLSPIKTGVAMIPMTALILVGAPLSSYLAKFYSPKRIIQLGLFIDLLGFVVLRQSFHFGANQWNLAPGFGLFGFGVGLIFGQASNLTLSSVSVEQSGEASGVNSTIRSLGQTLGSAVLGAILISTLGSNLAKGITASPALPQDLKPILSQAAINQTSNIEFGSGLVLQNTKLSTGTATIITGISHQATIDSTKTTLTYGAAFLLLTLLVSTQLPGGTIIEERKAVHKAAAH
jgi:EmrB/QacA subfamily drug resistance transporter